MKTQLNKKYFAFISTMLFFFSAANAQIVYIDVNPDSLIKGSYNLDLNNDGTTDFIFQGTSKIISCGRIGWAIKSSLSIAPANGNNEVMTDGSGYAIALLNGSAIVPDSLWSNTSQVLYDNGTTCYSVNTGHWTASNTDQYLGLRFTKNNNIYYGWARVTWNGILKDYAHNSAAGEPIFAGQGASTVFPQTAPAIQWQKSLGGNFDDIGNCILQTTDGGFIVAGQAESTDGDVTGNHGYYDYWIVKLNNSGTIQWQKSLGGSENDVAYSIIQTADGGYIVCGNTYSNDGDVSGNHGSYDGWVVKLNSTGTIEWQKSLGGSGDDFLNSIMQTADGGYILAGSTNSNDGDVSGNHGGLWDGWIVKLRISGAIEWQKCLGGTHDEDAFSIQQTADGGFIVAGNSNSNDGDVSGFHGDYFPEVYDWWVLKLNSIGTIEWQKCIGGSGVDIASSIRQTTDGGYIVCGETYSNDGDINGDNPVGGDWWIVKLNSTGTIEWQKILGSNGTAERASSIHQTTDGGYIAGGWSVSNDGDVSGNHGGLGDYWLVKLNSTGDPQWQKCLGGSELDLAFSIQQTTDGGYIVAGYAESNNGDVSGNHGILDCWIVKLGADVVLPLRLLSFTGILENNYTKLNWQATNEINTKDFIVERSNNAINFSAIGKVNAQTSSTITHSYHYTDTTPLPGTNYYRLKMEDKDDRFTYSNVIRINHNNGNEITISPNPAKNSLRVSTVSGEALTGKYTTAIINIYSSAMQLVQTIKITQADKNAITIPVERLAAGIYFLQLVNADRVSTVRFVKE